MTDPLIDAARFLERQLEWLRHATDEQGGPYAPAVFAEIAQCAGRLRGLLDDAPPKKYLGPCGAERQCEDLCAGGVCFEDDFTDECTCWCHKGESETCEGDVYGVRDAEKGCCRTCGAEVTQDDRAAWLDEEVRLHAFRAWEIAQVYAINVNTIRSWALRGRLRSYWRTDAGLTVEWTDPPLDPKLTGDELEARLGAISDEIQARGGRLHYVGDVLDLAAGDAARRETERAKRERRRESAA